MFQEIGFCQFCDAFRSMDRNENFSYDGKRALFDYLEGFEEDAGKEVELDVIALCCEYSEYGDLAEFQEAYGKEYETIEDIENKTAVIKIGDDSFIIQEF